MRIVLSLSTTPMGTLHGTARRSTDHHAVDFHGVLELVAVLDRLLAGDPGEARSDD
jgi:hypothetical protein